MARNALGYARAAHTHFLLIAAVSFALAACGGGSSATAPGLPGANGSGSGEGGGGSTSSPSASPSPCGCVKIKEVPTKDRLLGGIAFGQDNHIYASAPNGIDIFNLQLSLLPSPSPLPQARMRIPFTWPAVPKGSAATGPTISAGGTIGALGSAPSPTPKPGSSGLSAFDVTSGPKPTPSGVPMFAQFSLSTQTWATPSLGTFGDRFVSLSSPAGTSVFVVGDHLTSSGWVGFLLGFGVACISPNFTHPLGPSTIGPDGNLWVATDPSLNSNKPSDPESNPSMLFVVQPSTGTIKQSFTLPKGSHVSAMAAGDNAVWFTDDGLNEVGFVVIGGTSFTLLPLPNAGTSQAPVSISRDSMGRMWFTEFNGKRVGYVNPPTLQIFVFKVTGSPIGIVGCVPGQNCSAQNVFFAENAALGDASF